MVLDKFGRQLNWGDDDNVNKIKPIIQSLGHQINQINDLLERKVHMLERNLDDKFADLHMKTELLKVKIETLLLDHNRIAEHKVMLESNIDEKFTDLHHSNNLFNNKLSLIDEKLTKLMSTKQQE